MLLYPYTFTSTLPLVGDIDFTDTEWKRTSYMTYFRPTRRTLIETVSGVVYDTYADAVQADLLPGGIISFDASYRGATKQATQAYTLNFEANVIGQHGSLLCYDSLDGASGSQGNQYEVRVLSPTMRPIFNSEKDKTARFTLRFRLIAFTAGVSVP